MIWPKDIPFRRCDFTLERRIRTFDSAFTGYVQQADMGGSYWTANIELAWLSRRQAGTLLGLLADYGRSGILLPDAPHRQPLGAGGGRPVTRGENQGGQLDISGATANMPAWLAAGDLIQIGNHMHMLTRPATTDDQGNSRLVITPYLRQLPPPGTVVLTRDCATLMQLTASQTLPRRVSPRQRYLSELKLKFTEVIT